MKTFSTHPSSMMAASLFVEAVGFIVMCCRRCYFLEVWHSSTWIQYTGRAFTLLIDDTDPEFIRQKNCFQYDAFRDFPCQILKPNHILKQRIELLKLGITLYFLFHSRSTRRQFATIETQTSFSPYTCRHHSHRESGLGGGYYGEHIL